MMDGAKWSEPTHTHTHSVMNTNTQIWLEANPFFLEPAISFCAFSGRSQPERHSFMEDLAGGQGQQLANKTSRTKKFESETKVSAVKGFELIYWKRKLVTQAEHNCQNKSNKLQATWNCCRQMLPTLLRMMYCQRGLHIPAHPHEPMGMRLPFFWKGIEIRRKD